MTTKEFLDRYDNKKYFTENELEDLWWGDLLDIEIPVVGKEKYAEPDRWNTSVSKVLLCGKESLRNEYRIRY